MHSAFNTVWQDSIEYDNSATIAYEEMENYQHWSYIDSECVTIRLRISTTLSA